MAFGIPIQIVNPRITTGGALEFTVTGVLKSGSIYPEYSDDLITWTRLAGDPVTKLPATIRGEQPPLATHRYYRATAAP